MFLNSARHIPRYAGASIARMKRGGASKTTAGFVLAIGNPRHALAGWCDWMGDGVTAGWSTDVLRPGFGGLVSVSSRSYLSCGSGLAEMRTIMASPSTSQ